MSLEFPTFREDMKFQTVWRAGKRAFVAEFVGSALLLTAVVGSGIMASQLTGGIVGLALFMHAVTVGAFLIVLIHALGPISKTYFNPAVTIGLWWLNELDTSRAVFCIVFQMLGAVVGVVLAHMMFQIDLIDFGSRPRTGVGQAVGEFIATFVLMFAILAVRHSAPRVVPTIVGLVITSGILYTSSTSFANPAVTFGRLFTDTFTGIRALDVPLFIVVEVAAAICAVVLYRWLYAEAPRKDVS